MAAATSAATAAAAWHPHVPRIRFLGADRWSVLAAHAPQPRPRYDEPATVATAGPSSSPAAAASPTSATGAPRIYYPSVREVPYSFRRRHLSQAEMDLIEGGGVAWDVKPKVKK
ncbi:hypothetical protein HK405_007047 [Cladochytrium tenue]|nr:hypothetical protein HK405_007047 [Cladochytrium tenue]